LRSEGSALAASLRRGVLAGLAAGVLLGLFHLIFSEPLIERALAFEEKAADTPELFSRGDQQVGLIVASVLYGAALGGIFGFSWFVLAGRLREGTVWDRSLKLAFVGFSTLWLVPFLKYPSNPPAVGSASTISVRTAGYVGMIGISIAATALVWVTLRRFRCSEPHIRQTIAGAQYLLVVGLAFGLLPDSPDPIPVPADLIWSFRLMSAAGQGLLWLALAVTFALLTMRRKATSTATLAPAGPEGRSS
jgi:hypothetical protein